jgi:HPt (histidine-containing phosphotransfer) domain-containing protein
MPRKRNINDFETIVNEMGRFAAHIRSPIRGARLLSTGPAIDREKLSEQTFGDLEIRREVLGMFRAELPALLQALAATDGKPRSEIAHRLKGSSLAIGATALAEAAARLDAAPGAPGQLDAVEQAAAAVSRDIEALLAE